MLVEDRIIMIKIKINLVNLIYNNKLKAIIPKLYLNKIIKFRRILFYFKMIINIIIIVIISKVLIRCQTINMVISTIIIIKVLKGLKNIKMIMTIFIKIMLILFKISNSIKNYKIYI